MARGDALRRRRGVTATRARMRGFAYLWLLFFVAAMGASLAAGGVVWEVRVRREKERDLLAIGAEMRRAIADYYRLTPQAAKELPQRLEDLVEDKRGPALRRHLRRVYADPLTGRAEWGLVLREGRIAGVHSMAAGAPVLRGGFEAEYAAFEGAQSYAAWRFVAPVEVAAPAGGTRNPAAGTGAASRPVVGTGFMPATAAGANPVADVAPRAGTDVKGEETIVR